MKRPKPQTNTLFDYFSKKHLLVSLLLAVIPFIIYFQVTQSEFITLDDNLYIAENKTVQDGLTAKGIAWAFTTGHAGFWIPLTWLSNMVVVHFFGLDPGWHHLANLLLHLANTILLFLVLSRMTRAFWPSAFVAALFALHPLHVESVAWVTERKDVLSTFFWMLTMGLYLGYVDRPCFKRYTAVLLCFALGLMSKPMLVTLPFVLLLLDYWPLSRLERKEPDLALKPSAYKKKEKGASAGPKTPVMPAAGHWSVIGPLLLEKTPFFILAILSSIATYWTQRDSGAMNFFETLSLNVRFANALISYFLYIVKMVWPMDLAVLYPHPGSWPTWQVLVSGVLFIFFTLLAFRVRKTHPYGMVGWFWYAGTLVPVIGIIQVGPQSLADRFTYVPLIGLYIIIAWGLPEIIKTWSYRKQTLIALSALSLFGLSLLTWRQVGYWRNSLSLYNHTLSITKSNFLIQTNRGRAYFDLGMINEAMSDFNKAIEGNPRFALAYNNRGSVYGHLGDFQQAIKDFDKAIELDPGYASAYTNRGFAYSRIGNFDQALKDYDKATGLNPQSIAAYHNRGITHNQLGDFQRAIRDFNKAIELDPKFRASYYNRGLSYGRLGNHEQAIRDISVAARLGDKTAQDFLIKEGLSW
jgi:tetratricopeptide (TPR) repeat protein